ncbi:mitochondrial 54S ribosomal protein bL31m [Kluyveromyces lactis]|uniref:KLLA0B08888p n=1 Tax=Kluyveromyces lactis (strain ATCC 8585 / CBS 2359 / DSM 70799 / NBRC 1267 / NRRL Y-1140 / WM37) TaxID=284590 RepID=Q6CVW5_KLULA|nr:mitochondrial 54S ribosomal protein YmL36 [Kluyveromyces lactis]CAH02317.1 KLLA0B08888p [Kluyveromyces lactis]|eukprot:XP_451924.1 mitochondrial 54S ribosomal protein YmL36 [Kluyveromyces lactis]
MLKSLIAKRFASGGTAYHGVNQVSLPKRPLRKIRLGKARPAIYHQFDVQVELSDGSVITRCSQFPKNEIRLIQDQRNCPLWNQSRDGMVMMDANSSGRVDKFKQKYGSVYSMEEQAAESTGKKETAKKLQETEPEPSTDDFGMDDYLTLLNTNAVQVQKGGKMATKKKDKK